MLTFLILQRIHYGPKPRQFGIGKLLNHGAYGAAFPLHDGPKDPDYVAKSLPIRNKLWSQWSETKNIFKFQPLDTIRNYFGEKIGACLNHIAGFWVKLMDVNSLLFRVAWVLHHLANCSHDYRHHCLLLWHRQAHTIHCRRIITN